MNTYEELEERDQTDQGKEVSECRHERREPCPAVEHGTKEQRDEEQRQENCSIPHHRADGNDTNADERAWVLVAVPIGEGLDEHVCDDEEDGHDDGNDNLGEEHGTPACTGNVTR